MELKCIIGNVIQRMTAEPTAEGRWKLSFGYNKSLIEEVKAMAGAKWDPDRKFWTVDACRRNTFAFAVLENKERYKRFKREIRDFYSKIMEFLRSKGLSFWKHQIKMYDAIMDRRRCIIAAVPRSGKTLPTLTAFVNSECQVCWWVTTKTARLGVEREVHKWYAKDIHVLNDDSTNISVNRKRIMFFSYNQFSGVVEQNLDIIKSNPPQFLVFDECHKLKTIDTDRTQTAVRLSDLLEEHYLDSEYVVGLSGTPAPKDPSDWWTQCEVIRSGYIREGSIKKFKSRYGHWKPYDENTPVWERFLGWNKKELENFARRVAGIVFVFLDDCLDLPPLRYERIHLTPSSELLRVADMIARTEDNPLAARNKLRQISDGFQYNKEYNEETNSESKTVEFIGSPKIEMLKSHLEEYDEHGRICIYAGFHGSIDIIRQTCLSMGWNVLQIDGRTSFPVYHSTERFDDGSLSTSDRSTVFMALGEMDRSTNTSKVEKLAVVAHPLSGGAGNEFSASLVSIYYSNPDSGEARMQSEKRGHSNNMDKERGHTIIDYILLPTDEKILNDLLKKKDLQAISMGDLQHCIEQYMVENSKIIDNVDMGSVLPFI